MESICPLKLTAHSPRPLWTLKHSESGKSHILFKVEFRAWSIEQPTSTEEPPKPKLRFLSFAFPNNKTKIQRGLLRDPQVGNHNQASKSRSCASCLLHFLAFRKRAFKALKCKSPTLR